MQSLQSGEDAMTDKNQVPTSPEIRANENQKEDLGQRVQTPPEAP